MTYDFSEEQEDWTEEPSTEEETILTGAILFGMSLVLGVLCLMAFPSLVSRLTGTSLTGVERIQLHLIQLGLACGATLLGVWGLYELIRRRPGPLVLFSLLALFPLLIPFFFFGYGSDPESWSMARAAYERVASGEFAGNGAWESPLFGILVGWIVPSFSWPGLIAVNLLAGWLGILVWLALPGEIGGDRARLVALLCFLQPLYLLACGTGTATIWQTAFLSAAMVALLRALSRDHGVGLGMLLLAAVGLGLSCGFHLSSLAALPVFLGVLCLGRDLLSRRFLACGLFAGTFGLVLGLSELPVLLHSGILAFGGASDSPVGESRLYVLLRYSLTPPAILALVLSWVFAVASFFRWSPAERLLYLLAVLLLAVGLGGFLLLPGGTSSQAILLPALAVLLGISVPRPALAFLIPLMLIWNVASIPLVSRDATIGSTLDLRPSVGPVVEEVRKRFETLRRGQLILMVHSKKPTAVVVGRDWEMLAALRPKWEIPEPGILACPDIPVTFHRGIDAANFDRMQSTGTRFLVVEEAARWTLKKHGYDPIERGAEVWTPKMRFYQ